MSLNPLPKEEEKEDNDKSKYVQYVTPDVSNRSDNKNNVGHSSARVATPKRTTNVEVGDYSPPMGPHVGGHDRKKN